MNVLGSSCITVTQIPVPGLYKISGIVTYDGSVHTPLDNITIQLVNSLNAVVATTTTATVLDASPNGYSSGYYEFTGLNAGTYTLRARFN